jgi:aspartate aminotransferase
VEPRGTFYALPDVRAWVGKSYRGAPLADTLAIAEALLTDFELAVVPGGSFGAEGHLRLSFAASLPMLEKALDRLGRFAAALS